MFYDYVLQTNHVTLTNVANKKIAFFPSDMSLKNMKFNFGLYDKVYELQHNIDNIPELTDLGITLGFGIDYLNKNSYDIAFVFGKRSSEFNEFFNERYFKLTLSLIIYFELL